MSLPNEEQLRALVAEIVNLPAEKITRETRFVADLHMDSLTSLDLLTELEERHGIEITQADARVIQSFGDMVAHVDRLR